MLTIRLSLYWVADSPTNISIFPTATGPTHHMHVKDKLVCRSSANPPANYTWRVYTDYGFHVMFQDGANLVIKHPMDGHFLATCTAWNIIGGEKLEISTTVKVKIICKFS